MTRFRRKQPSGHVSIIVQKVGVEKSDQGTSHGQLYRTINRDKTINVKPDHGYIVEPIQLPPEYKKAVENYKRGAHRPNLTDISEWEDEYEEEMRRIQEELEEYEKYELPFSDRHGNPLHKVGKNEYISDWEAQTDEGKAKIAAWNKANEEKKANLTNRRRTVLEERQKRKTEVQVQTQTKQTTKKKSGAKKPTSTDSMLEAINQSMSRMRVQEDSGDALDAGLSEIIKNAIEKGNTTQTHVVLPPAMDSDPTSKHDSTVITGTFHSADPTTHTAIGHDETKIINFTVFQDKSMLERRQNRRSSIAPLKDFAEFVKSVAATSTPRHSLATAGLFHPLDMSAITEASSSRSLSSEKSESSSSSRDTSTSSNFEESINEDEEDERQAVTAEEPTINETAVEPHESTLKDATVDDTLVSNKDVSEEKENVQPSDVTKAHGTTAATETTLNKSNDIHRQTLSTTANTTYTSFIGSMVGGKRESTRIEVNFETDEPYFLKGLPRDASMKDKLCGVCSQKDYIKWTDLPKDVLSSGLKKLGEGQFGEVFKTKYRGNDVAMKVVPLNNETNTSEKLANGDYMTSFPAAISEITIAKELTNLNSETAPNASSTFCQLIAAHVVEGKFPPELGRAWDRYKKEWEGKDEDKAMNDDPSEYGNDAEQIWVLLAFELCGTELEDMKLESASQFTSIMAQLSLALIIAETELEFEHRDMHISNVLVSPTSEEYIEYKLDFHKYRVKTNGLRVKIIDYSLSRINLPDALLYRDLAADCDIFDGGEGMLQFETYRWMRENCDNNWRKYSPYSNILWMGYTGQTLLADKHRPPEIKGHSKAQWTKAVKKFYDLGAVSEILKPETDEAKQASEIILKKFFNDILTIEQQQRRK
ncbi:hypothetical protein WR25_25414 [Diploscapter pachys]|uniref:non-specific serine/threonine protein kinase n=1 Tax=Diploscapter pachys TaxID=2018661 RepID=A0A2A2JGI5_9BILA|nr:hypothetical protein WR25_25414 [Diploscapter pachys]